MSSRSSRWTGLAGWAACLALLLLIPDEAQAYVGPGAGFAFVTSFFLLLTTALLTLLALLSWPLRALWRLVTRKRPPNKPRAKRVVVLGLDGLDPRVARELMEQGRLPNFSRLAQRGSFGELATTCPAMSPVAWSSFATGVDPSRHGIFDFLTRDPRDYSTVLSSTEIRPPRRALKLGPWRLPLGKPSIRMLRRGVPFWKILGQHGVPSTILRVPITFPPDRFDGTLLSGMCVPDLHGSQGSYLHYREGDDEVRCAGGRLIRVKLARGRVETHLPGPPHPLREDRRELRLKLRLDLDVESHVAKLRVGSQRLTLREGQYSDWVELAFPLLPGLKVRGICRFRLISLEPLSLYVTPVNIDPTHPAMPVAHPFIFSVFLSKLIGRFSTLGLAEDTGALNDEVIDEAAFLEQAQLFHREREAMFFEMLRRHRRGACVCVFDITDRVQHMFMAERGRAGSPHAGAIDELYVQMDELLGRVLQEVAVDDRRTQLMVLSDHGFAPFERGVNLNTWLLEQGYMTLEPGRERCGEYLEGVDWSRTRAFALGLSGIYLNLAGREAGGVVPQAEAAALRAELAQKLRRLEDPGSGSDQPPIGEVFDTHERYSGPFLDRAPDLIVGYSRGYRASWETARGSGGEAVIEANTRHWSGDHCMDPRQVPGVLFSSGGLETRDAALTDIAPTILELFGIPKPANMTGRSLVAAEPSG